MPEELWTEVYNTVQETVTIRKWLSEEALQIAEKRRDIKGKGKRQDKPIQIQISRQ